MQQNKIDYTRKAPMVLYKWGSLSSFIRLFFQSIHDQLESPVHSDLIEGVDFRDGVLEVTLSDGRGVLVLNKHYIHRQIWYSSPNRYYSYFVCWFSVCSGADYFDFASTPPWTSQRCGTSIQSRVWLPTAISGITVTERLSADLSVLAGRDVIIQLNSRP